MTKLKNPENYEALVKAIAFIDAAKGTLDDDSVDGTEDIQEELWDIRNDLNQRRLACLGGAYDVDRFVARQSIERGK